MKNLIYLMIFQMFLGLWLFVSPFVLGFGDLMGAAINHMVVGAILIVLSIGVTFYEYYQNEALSRGIFGHGM